MKLGIKLQAHFPLEKIVSSMKRKHSEPNQLDWYYIGIYNPVTFVITHSYSDTYEEVSSIVKDTDSLLWIVKHQNIYISSITHPIRSTSKSRTDVISKVPVRVRVQNEISLPLPMKSNLSFIFIEYIDIDHNNTISLHLPETYLYVGNELFSPAFVLRLLEQQSEDYVFDGNYTISILDQQLRNIHLNSRQYLVLEKDNCHILYY
jgi:hypothetical protein